MPSGRLCNVNCAGKSHQEKPDDEEDGGLRDVVTITKPAANRCQAQGRTCKSLPLSWLSSLKLFPTMLRRKQADGRFHLPMERTVLSVSLGANLTERLQASAKDGDVVTRGKELRGFIEANPIMYLSWALRPPLKAAFSGEAGRFLTAASPSISPFKYESMTRSGIPCSLDAAQPVAASQVAGLPAAVKASWDMSSDSRSHNEARVALRTLPGSNSCQGSETST